MIQNIYASVHNREKLKEKIMMDDQRNFMRQCTTRSFIILRYLFHSPQHGDVCRNLFLFFE